MSGKNISFVFIVFVFLLSCFTVQAEEIRSSVLILPFDTSSAGKYSYLKEGIRNMFSTRLAAKDGIQIRDHALSQKELNELKNLKQSEMSKGLLTRLHADYVVSGALYSVSGQLHMQLTFFPVSAKGKSLKFTMIAENENKILSSLDQLTDEIGDRLSKPRKKDEVTGGPPQETDKGRQTGVTDGMVGFHTVHPERMYKRGIYNDGGIVGSENGGMQVSVHGVRKSSPISMDMVGMAVGDLDGDGVKEIVLVDNGELRIFHFQHGRFSQMAKASISPRLKIHAVNLADLDHDGRDEIYISATDQEFVSSLIAEWNARQGLHILYSEVPWYLRPLKIPGKGVILAGQDKGTQANNLVSPGIYELKINKGSALLTKGKMLPLPKEVNLFDFVFADLNGDGQVETVAIDRQEKLLVYDQGKTLLWVSTDNFGGSTNYLGPQLKTDDAVQARIFVPTRLVAVDLNNDKKQEIIVARNKKVSSDFLSNISSDLLSNFRMYDGGFVSCMEWTGSAMHQLWRTNSTEKMVVDYNLQLMAGSDEILKTSSVIQRQKGSGGKQSAILFVGRVPGSKWYNILLPKRSETDLFAYDIYVKGKTKEKE